MNILLLGADGQLGRELRRSLAPLGRVTALGRAGDGPLTGDLLDREGLAETVRAVRPDVLVNAAAYTAVDRAETDRDTAFAVNALACGTLAREAQALGAWFVHFSTDYVFDGSGARPWREDDAPAPLGVYGESKLAGERAVASGCDRHAIFRTSWVYETHGENFVRAILRAAQQRDSLRVVDDQWGAPARAAWLADVTAQVLPRLDASTAGLYHLAPAGAVSRHGMAVRILERAAKTGCALQAAPAAVEPVPTAAMPSAARRPLNSRLDTARFASAFGIEPPPWQPALDAAVTELANSAPR